MTDSDLEWLEDELTLEYGSGRPKRLRLADTPGMHVQMHKQDNYLDDTYEIRLRGYDHSQVGEIVSILNAEDGISYQYYLIEKRIDYIDTKTITTVFKLVEKEEEPYER